MSSGGPFAAPAVLIAVIDDEPAIRVSLARLCGALGMRAVAFASGQEFIDALDGVAVAPDCLLLDAHMPSQSGLEIQQQLVRRAVRFPTIVYSADDTPEALDRYIQAGAVDYLQKPITAEQLVSAIEHALATSKSEVRVPRPPATLSPTPEL